jgi:hypothetical protein
MADVKISGLPASTVPLAGTEVLPIVQGGATKQVSIANVTAGRAVSAASLALTTTPLEVGSGGTGLTTLTANYIPYGNGTGAYSSSSNLTFNGSTFSVNGFATFNSSGAQLLGISKSNGPSCYFGVTSNTDESLRIQNSGGATTAVIGKDGSATFGISPASAQLHSFYMPQNTQGISFNAGAGSAYLYMNSTDSSLYIQDSGGNTSAVFRAAGGGTEFNGSSTATSFIPNSATIPTNGMYLPAANTIGWATASTARVQIGASGGVSIGNTTDPGTGGLIVSGLMYPQQAATASAPGYVKGAIYFDTTLNKLRVGGATGCETITSI